MKNNFILCLEETLKWEGGYSNHPSDPGGATNLGITQERYNQYNKDLGLPIRPVKQITKDEAVDIYRKYYWDVINGDNLPTGIDLIMFDFAVNSGPSRAIDTLNKVKSDNNEETINKYMNEREAYLRSLKKLFAIFGKGWMNRTKGIRKKALSMINTKTNKDLVVKNSTKLSTLKTIRKGLTGVTVVGGGLMTLDTISNAATITSYLQTFLTNNWIPLTLGAIAVAYLFFKWLEYMHIVDFEEGRYTPSGLSQAKGVDHVA